MKPSSNVRKLDETLMNQIGNKIGEVREYVEDKVETATDLYETGSEKTKYFVRDTRSTIKKYPLASVTIAAAGGWLLGRIFSK